jgi:citrate synthase
MSEPANTTTAFKPKKSVALSGVAAGNTALCTVGKSGNDLHYRGYDILYLAEVQPLKKWLTCLFMEHCLTRQSSMLTKQNYNLSEDCPP